MIETGFFPQNPVSSLPFQAFETKNRVLKKKLGFEDGE
jgi:hypothetical protein